MLLSTNNLMIGDVVKTRDGHEVVLANRDGNFFITTQQERLHIGDCMCVIRGESKFMIYHTSEEIQLLIQEKPADEYPKAVWPLEKERKENKQEKEEE